MRITVHNEKVHCEFSSITGGRLLNVVEAPSLQKRGAGSSARQEVLASYNHEHVRSELASVVNQLDSIMVSISK